MVRSNYCITALGRDSLMSNYKSYPKKKDTPSRKTRKSERTKVFQFNRKARKLSATQGE